MKFTEVSNEFAERAENSLCMYFKGMTGFITVSNSGSEEPRLEPVNITSSDLRNSRTPPVAFSGQGHRLGGGDIPPQSRLFAKFDNVDTP